MESVKSVNAGITDQDAKFDKKIGKQIQPLSLQIKDNSLKLNEQDNQIS